MQTDQQLISQLQEAAKGAKQTLDETKQRHKARITALRSEQRQEVERIQAQVRGYEKALKAVAMGNGQPARQEGEAASDSRLEGNLGPGRATMRKEAGETSRG